MKMNIRKRRIISLLLAFVMVMNLMPMPITYADENVGTEIVCDCGYEEYLQSEEYLTATDADGQMAGHKPDCAIYHEPESSTLDCGCESETHEPGCELYVIPTCTECGAENNTHKTDCLLYEGPKCECDNEDGTHNATCPSYTCPKCNEADCYVTCPDQETGSGEEIQACTCGATEGTAHGPECPLYTCPECGASEYHETCSISGGDVKNCTCGATEEDAHDTSCPLFVCGVCDVGAGELHKEYCPLYICPVCEITAGEIHNRECPYYSCTNCGVLGVHETCPYDEDIGKYLKLDKACGYYGFNGMSDILNGTSPFVMEYEDFKEDTIMHIIDWYWHKETTGLWYEVEFYSGGLTDSIAEELVDTWPNELWALQRYTETEQECAFEFVEIGTTPEKPTYTYCGICGNIDCGIKHLYCVECKEFDCNKDHTHENTYKPSTTPTIPENPTMTEGEDVSIVDENGNAVTVDGFQLHKSTKTSLSAWSALEADESAVFQWQICYDLENDLWTDILGQNGKGILISPAMVHGIIDAVGVANLRCEIRIEGTVQYSATIPVTVAEEVSLEARQFNVLKETNNIATDTETPELKSYSVVIKYVFENEEVVAEPYTATLAAGSNFSATVAHPSVMGYLPYIGNSTETSDKVELNILNIQADVTYTVTYKPTNVSYTVFHHQQNVDNDGYTLKETETKQGLTNSTVLEVAKNYEGFYALLYEKPAIAADGSTEVEIYYDRNYYLVNFDMGGGYGTEPIYVRYGASITAKDPTKAGYTFQGWSLNGVNVIDLPSTVPANNVTYIAVWKANETAKVSVTIWGENADDEGYSYIKSTEFYAKPGETITYCTGNIACGYDEEHTHTATCYKCDDEEHTHSADCCTITAHTHGADCCTIEAHTHSEACCSIAVHTHSSDCYSGEGNQVYIYDAPNNVSNGYVYNGWYYLREWKQGNVVYINGNWYTYSGTVANNYATTTCGKTEGSHSGHTCVYNKCGYTIEHQHTDGNCVYCNEVEHTHNGTSCVYCDLTEHTHTDACLSCTKDQHNHSSSCYITDPGMSGSLWTYVESDTVTVAADGSSVMNVYYDRTSFTLTFRASDRTVATITEKWGASISDEFEKAPFNTTYNGRAWKCTESSKYGYALQTLDIMPKFNATFNLYDKSSNTLKTIYYYVENVGANVSHSTWPTSTANFTLLKEVDTYFNFATYEEEYHEMEGFTRYSLSVSGFGSDKEKDFDRNNKLYLYYLRNSYILDFNNGYEVVKSESVEYEDVLDQYNSYIPPVPTSYEPGSVEFAGWYLNPECTGEQVNLNTYKMPCSNLVLYAKWTPVNRTVEFYLDKDEFDSNVSSITATHPTLTVPHGSKVETKDLPVTPTKGDYEFIGWFYMDGEIEKAFNFNNMIVTKDMKVYGKWSSNVLKEYIVYFKMQGTDTQVADPIKGSTKAGLTKTFDAKVGTDLYSLYQEGYFPLIKSHSMTLDINTPNIVEDGWTEITDDDGNKKIIQSFTFEYVPRKEVPYTVYYVAETLKAGEDTTQYETITRDGKTYYIIAESYTNSENRKSVVTEKFKAVSGYMPDAYQKRLVVNGTEEALNEIIFYYKVDTAHAYYKITHYTQNTDGKNWTEYASSQAVGEINTSYTASPMIISGFSYNNTEYYVRDLLVENVTDEGAVLTLDGLEIRLYYVRNSYPYKVKYLEQGTGKQLADSKEGSGLYGQMILEEAKDIDNYTVVNSSSQTLTIRIEESQTEAKLNVITFYYEEKEVNIKYEIVGPGGCGTVDPESEAVKILTGKANGSTATASEDYQFVGWYSDNECTNLLSPNVTFVPTKEKDATWIDGTTYYAKFELAVADLTIIKKVVGTTEEDIFLFHIKGEGVDMDVTITGSDSVTIKNLPVGIYTVTEDTSWSWRYTTESKVGSEEAVASASRSVEVSSSGGIVTFFNTLSKNKWLNFFSRIINRFTKSSLI